MPGVKGKSGGARFGVGGRKSNGGAGRGQGRLPEKIEVELSKAASQELRLLTAAGGQAIDSNTLQSLVESYIHEKWLGYDQAIQQAVEEMEEFV